MNIYCAGPIKGDVSYQKFYIEIISHIDSLGLTALSELNNKFSEKESLTAEEIFNRDIGWIKKSDLIIAEVSGPSLGVGFEIAFGLYQLNIPVLALYNKEVKKVSAMITGCNSKLLTVIGYTNTGDLKNSISTFIKNLEK
ncbi:MAG TPA: nucleoside 2-deoxyribosyltransferase [Ignavibacteriaceae bacterium]|nr:nucleoside 2-deoxyribosyltransferase [Ignavibacteriaceae bacterium]